MKSSSLLLFTVSAALLNAAGCHRQAQPQAAAAKAQTQNGPRTEYWPGLGNVIVADPTSGRGAGGGGGEGGGDGDDENSAQRFHPATVYIDGAARVAFTYNEMPPATRTSKYEWEEGAKYTHIRICDYFKALGADCDRVKESHWYGGRDRVVVITGDMLRKHRNDLYFNFTRELFGKPRLETRGALKTNDTVDVVTDLAIYVHKKPPRWDRDQWSLVDDQGRPIEGIPYSHDMAPRRAVRLNLDGRLAGYLKRNLLEGNVRASNEGAAGEEPRYRLEDLLAANHFAARSFRGIDLVTRDERVIRLTPAQVRAGVEFSAPRHSGGEVIVHLGKQTARASVFNLYVEREPPRREMRTLTLEPAPMRMAGATANKTTN